MITRISKVRRLPAQGTLLVGVGDQVTPDTAIGRVNYMPGQLTRFNIATELGVAPQYLTQLLGKQPGDWVEQGEPLAVSEEFFIRHEALSPQTGYVGLVSRHSGDVYIRQPLPAGPKEPLVVRAADYGFSLFQFASNKAVDIGWPIEQGQVLIYSGFGKKTVLSPIFGWVSDISTREGTITVTPMRQATEVSAHIGGEVTAIEPGESVTVTTTVHLVQGAIGYGGEHVGRLLPPTGGAELTVDDLPTDLSGAVVVSRGGATLEALKRCADGGAAGVVLGSARYEVLKAFLGSDPVQTLGTSVDLPLALILINGFGDLPLTADVERELQYLAGRTASVDGSTHLRAGVLRPEVVVALADEGDITAALASATGLDDPLTPGARVLVVRAPHFGVIGRLSALAPTPLMVASEAVVNAAVITREDDGSELTVPLANLRRIEEASRHD